MAEGDPIIMHVDMDAFFAAVEVRNNPHLKGKPVIVGGTPGKRGVVSTCSYEARKYGIHSGMSTAQAYRLCPHAEFVSAGLKGYLYTSARLLQLFETYSPIVEPFSVDEAFLDLTGCEKQFDSIPNLVYAMKNEIWEKLQLTCSVGIGPSKLIAKMASGMSKPNGFTTLDREQFKQAIYPRPVDALIGVGKSTRNTLENHGINTVGDLARADRKHLERIFGKNGTSLSIIARGEDTTIVTAEYHLPDDKSMSHETTFQTDVQDPDLLKASLLWLSDKVARRMRIDGYVGRTVSIKVRSPDFSTITRSYTFRSPTNRFDVIFKQALSLLPVEYGSKKRVRLLGVRVSQLARGFHGLSREKNKFLREYPEQLELIQDENAQRFGQLSDVIDSIRDKYGETSIRLAGTRYPR
jgi:DNA polymerase-4